MTTLPLNQIALGDCIEFMNSLPENSIDLIFADPPYNLQLENSLMRPDQSIVDAVNDHWDQFASFETYDRFTREWMTAARRVLKKTGTLWVIGSYHNIYRVGSILMDIGYWILNDVVWVKHNPMPQMKGVRLCNAHETLIWAKKSKEATGYTFHYKSFKAGNEDLQLRSDWYFPICSGGERETTEDGTKAHATQKPEGLLHRIIATCSNLGDVVLDPFCGSGTTAAVAKALGRSFITIDREADYVEVARRRVDRVTPYDEVEGGVFLDQPKPKVRFLSLVENGVLPPGTRLVLDRTRVEAIVHEDGTISANGVRGSIHKVGKLMLGLPACNGWEHWLYRDPESGEERLIDDLRPAAALPEPFEVTPTARLPREPQTRRGAIRPASSPSVPVTPAPESLAADIPGAETTGEELIGAARSTGLAALLPTKRGRGRPPKYPAPTPAEQPDPDL